MSNHKGYVYLIHFEEKLHHAGHYIGWSQEYPLIKGGRLDTHKKGQGARILNALVERGIGFNVVQIWHDQNGFYERKLKNRKNAGRECWKCKK